MSAIIEPLNLVIEAEVLQQWAGSFLISQNARPTKLVVEGGKEFSIE